MHTMQLRKINGYLQKLLYTVKRIRMSPTPTLNIYFCAIVLYLVVYHVCFQDGKLCLLVANDKLDGK
jgi:hypothetical protein